MTDAAPDSPFDEGLQPERTLLAWRRTCLSLAIGGAIAVRLATPTIGPFVILAGIACVGAAVGGALAASKRYRRMHLSLVSTGAHTEGALAMALTASSAAALAVLGLIVVIAVAL